MGLSSLFRTRNRAPRLIRKSSAAVARPFTSWTGWFSWWTSTSLDMLVYSRGPSSGINGIIIIVYCPIQSSLRQDPDQFYLLQNAL